MRGAGAAQLGLVLDRLGQHCGIAVAFDFRPGRFQRGENRRDRAVGIDRDFLVLEAGERRFERVAIMDPHAVAQMRAHRVGDLFRRDEQISGGIRMQ